MSKKNENDMSDDELESLLGFSLDDPLGMQEPPERMKVNTDNPLFKDMDFSKFMAMTSEETIEMLYEKEAKKLNLPKEKSSKELKKELESLIDVIADFTKGLPDDFKDVMIKQLQQKLGVNVSLGNVLNLSSPDRKSEPKYYHVLFRGFMRKDSLKFSNSEEDGDDDDDGPTIDDILKEASGEKKKEGPKFDIQIPVTETELVLSSGEGLFVPSIVRNYICGLHGYSSVTILNWKEITKEEYDVEVDYGRSKDKNEIDDLIRSVGGY